MDITQIAPISQTIHNNHLQLGGVDICTLAQEKGTPLYILDAETIRHQCKTYQNHLQKYYDNFLIVYAGKANLSIGLLKLLNEEGLGVDVVSEGELHTAFRAKIPTKNILFHGNNKSHRELELAIENNIRIMVDNLQEIENILKICEKKQAVAHILLRIKPGIEAHTHTFIKTGQLDSKFGMSREEMDHALHLISGNACLNYLGLHGHIGSQIFQLEPYHELGQFMTQTASHIKTTFKLETSEIDLGGGLGVFYTSEDTPPPIEDYIRTLTTSLKQGCEMHHIKQPKLIIEPGRSLIARAGITLYKIGTLKSIPGIREYCFVDGGMADNMRPLLYQAEYTWKLAGKMESPNTHTYTIAGKFCESGDILAKEVPLPEIQPGDLLLSYTTGAYSSSMASNYNRFCRPATVLVENGQATTLVKRETIDDLLRLDETGEES